MIVVVQKDRYCHYCFNIQSLNSNVLYTNRRVDKKVIPRYTGSKYYVIFQYKM